MNYFLEILHDVLLVAKVDHIKFEKQFIMRYVFVQLLVIDSLGFPVFLHKDKTWQRLRLIEHVVVTYF